jgi:hypothetical protein
MKGNILSIIVGVSVLLVGAYFAYSMFKDEGSTTDVRTVDLGPNITAFIAATAGKPLNFNMQKIFQAPLVAQLQDFSEVIPRTTSRGRENPFTPYASPRPIR